MRYCFKRVKERIQWDDRWIMLESNDNCCFALGTLKSL